ncbi:MAG TPA: hypothetical protein VGA04_24730 [Streptosporangiaceae bacterium]
MGENPVWHGHPDPFQRLLRTADSEELPARQRGLTCPVFLSGPEFLPELREQRHRTLTLIEVSTGKGQTRVAEMNQRVLTNLDKMIGEIAKDEKSEAADAG